MCLIPEEGQQGSQDGVWVQLCMGCRYVGVTAWVWGTWV